MISIKVGFEKRKIFSAKETIVGLRKTVYVKFKYVLGRRLYKFHLKKLCIFDNKIICMKNLILFLATVLIICLSVNVNAQNELSKKYINIELFTNTFCGLCANYDPAAIATYNQNIKDIHLITHYPNVPYPQCSFYQANTVDNLARRGYYGNFSSTPRTFTQGTQLNTSSNLITQSTINSNAGQLSPIRLKVNVSGGGNNKTATVDVQTLSAVSGNNLKLYVAAVVENVAFNAPNGLQDHHNVFWQFLTNENGDNYSPAAIGSSNTYTFNYNVGSLPHPNWNSSEVFIIAFVQEDASKNIINSGSSKDIVIETTNLVNDCGNNSGAIDIAISGGNAANYNISWNNGATGTSLTGLSAGTYMVTVGDGTFETYTEYTISQENVSAGNNASFDACEGQDNVIDLFYALGPNAVAGGTWTDPNGNSSSGFYTNDSDPGGVYTYTVSVGGCNASATVTINYNSFPAVPNLMGVPTMPISTNAPVNLSGTPAGGVFSGPGVIFNAFNPSVAGPGVHTITYTVSNQCGSASDSQDVLIFTITFNFVNYNLGTVSPRVTSVIESVFENDELNLLLNSSENEKANLVIHSIDGKLVFDDNVDLQTSQNNIVLNSNAELQAGNYIATIQLSDKKITTPILVK